MLEVINGFLLIYFAVLCTLSTLVPVLVKPIVTCFSRPSNEERTLLVDIRKLKLEQKSISMKDEFAAYSKLQRKINKLECELRDGSQSRMTRSLAVKSTIQLVLQAIFALLVVVSVIWFRREPIVAFKANLFPFSTMLRYPSQVPNAISTHMWVIMSNMSIRCFLSPILK